MASIRRRDFKQAYLYEVQVRRAGVPSITVSFSTQEEADEWARENEFKYLRCPEDVRYDVEERRLTNKRRREECRKSNTIL